MTTKTCSKCNSTASSESKFCTNCGYDFYSNSLKPQAPQQYQQEKNQNLVKKKKSSSGCLKILGFWMLLIVSPLVLFIVFNIVENLMNSSGRPSRVVKDYYAAIPYGTEEYHVKAYKLKLKMNLAKDPNDFVWDWFDTVQFEKKSKRGKIKSIKQKIDGNEAVVFVVFQDGSREEIDLVKINGEWKMYLKIDDYKKRNY